MPPESNNHEVEKEKVAMVDRLANALFASPASPLTAFADRQRVERLGQCREFESILKACQDAHKSKERVGEKEIQVNPSATDESALATTKSGTKIARFFGWNSPHSDQINDGASDNNRSIIGDATAVFTDQNQNDGNGQSNKPSKTVQFSAECAKETHELWTCRALAVGCGQHVSDLRHCWESTLADGSKDSSCRDIQQSMARCVTKNTSELKERINAAKKK